MNADKNNFDQTVDSDLVTETETMSTVDEVSEGKSPEKSKKKAVVIAIGSLFAVSAAFAIYQIVGGMMGDAPKNSTMKPTVSKPAPQPPKVFENSAAVVPVLPAQNGSNLSVVIPEPSSPNDPVSVTIGSTSATPPTPGNVVSPNTSTNTVVSTTPAIVEQKKVVEIASSPVVDNKKVVKTEVVDTKIMSSNVSPQTPVQDVGKFVKVEDFEKLTKKVNDIETEVNGLKLLESRIKGIENNKGASSVVVKRVYAKSSTESAKKNIDAKGNKATDDKKSEARPGFWLEDKHIPLTDVSNSKAPHRFDSSIMQKARSQLAEDKSVKVDSQIASQKIVDSQSLAKAYQLIAIVQGRAWVKQADGTMLTIQEGEALPNGSKIVKIDPKKDEIQTTAGVLK